MKKTIAAIIAILMLFSMSVTAFAAVEPVDTTAFPAVTDRDSFLANFPFTPYEGEDFSEEAILERIMSMQDLYPTDTPWGMKQGVACNTFASMMQSVAFGYEVAGWRDTHTDLNRLRVGDIIGYINRQGGHAVFVIDINGDKITVAEGNYNAKVLWGRELSKKQLKSTLDLIYTCYEENGDLTSRQTCINRNEKTETTPVQTTTAKPTTTVPAKTTVTETTPATTAVASGTLVVTNITTVKMKSFSVTLGEYHKNLGSGSKDKDYTSFKSALETYGFKLTSPANSDSVTVSYAGATATIQVGQTVEITANGTVTIK